MRSPREPYPPRHASSPPPPPPGVPGPVEFLRGTGTPVATPVTLFPLIPFPPPPPPFFARFATSTTRTNALSSVARSHARTTHAAASPTHPRPAGFRGPCAFLAASRSLSTSPSGNAAPRASITASAASVTEGSRVHTKRRTSGWS
eukprot:30930-Pelagococcus_subviridis.AAC.3